MFIGIQGRITGWKQWRGSCVHRGNRLRLFRLDDWWNLQGRQMDDYGLDLLGNSVLTVRKV